MWLTAGGVNQRAAAVSGGSYASSCDPRLHIGLGAATAVDTLEIRWPSGLRETVPAPPVDAVTMVTEGKGAPAAQARK